ncbi:MAG TPA: hypothetical protein VD838_05290, partial [Anaeromyxobacteraceae bacterium]|nr:hypothetical protein [Anaeromyxobacteraceae bacterium]
ARTLNVPAGVRIGAPEGEGVALADEGRLRPALREAIRGAAATLPRGGEVRLRVSRRGAEAVVEIAADGVAADREPWLPLVRALLGPGARVAGEAVPGRGTVCRIAFPAAPPDLVRDEEIQLISEP